MYPMLMLDCIKPTIELHFVPGGTRYYRLVFSNVVLLNRLGQLEFPTGSTETEANFLLL